MKKTIFSKAIAILGSIAMLVGVAACGQSNDSTKTAADGNGLTKVTFMLSWAPDTNHIGVYVAKNKGYFKHRQHSQIHARQILRVPSGASQQ